MTSEDDNKWRNKLSDEQYAVCRLGATEPAFSGKYLNEKSDGTYSCVACNAPLFSSNRKYNSGCGWPSFYEAINKNAINEISDKSHGMVRVEIKCAKCQSHLGHVFPDGPKPTGLRYCTNSLSLKFLKS
jgi:peptide-methionine (R)-S-oxide reductase